MWDQWYYFCRWAQDTLKCNTRIATCDMRLRRCHAAGTIVAQSQAALSCFRTSSACAKLQGGTTHTVSWKLLCVHSQKWWPTFPQHHAPLHSKACKCSIWQTAHQSSNTCPKNTVYCPCSVRTSQVVHSQSERFAKPAERIPNDTRSLFLPPWTLNTQQAPLKLLYSDCPNPSLYVVSRKDSLDETHITALQASYLVGCLPHPFPMKWQSGRLHDPTFWTHVAEMHDARQGCLIW